MSDKFDSRLRSAVRAGWLTLLIALVVFLIQWIAYLFLVPAQPSWLLTLWGPAATWQEVRTVWFWFLAFFKFCLFLTALVLIWATLWVRQLKK